MMKLSDAMMLGRTIVTPTRGFLLKPGIDGGLHGCALGMACAAISYPVQNQRLLDEIMSLWPWTARFSTNAEVPCHRLGHCSIAYMIAHIFDDHIMGMNGLFCEPSWTLDGLIEWILANEPQEDSFLQTEVSGHGTHPTEVVASVAS